MIRELLAAAIASAAVAATPATVDLWPSDLPEGARPIVACEDVVAATEAIHTETPVPLPDGWDLIVECGTDHQWQAQARLRQREIVVRPEMMHAESWLRWLLIHETGHAWDHQYLTDAHRAVWTVTRGLDGEWMPHVDSWDDWYNPSEDFAEAFTVCASGSTGHLNGQVPEVTAGHCRLIRAMVAAGQL